MTLGAWSLALLPSFLLASLVAAGATSSTISETDLAAISERGILLAGYDAAAWHATDAVMALNPPAGTVSRYVARRTARGWVVAFGRLNRTSDRFMVSYEAVQSDSSEHFEVQKYEPFRPDTGYNLAAARAIERSLKDFRGANCPYNVAVLPASPGGLFVYVYPAQVKVGVYPYGADVRYKTSIDGSTILVKRQLHRNLIESTPAASPGRFAGGYHVHVLSDLPEDTDVLLVLTREPRAPETVTTETHVFTIDTSGRISVVGRSH